MMMPKLVNKSHSSHVFETTLVKQKQRRPCREYRCGTCQILFEGQVRELFTTLECQSWGKLCILWFVKVLGFYNSIGLTSVPWHRGPFLVGKVFINTCILREAKMFTYILMRGGQARPCQTRQRFAYPL